LLALFVDYIQPSYPMHPVLLIINNDPIGIFFAFLSAHGILFTDFNFYVMTVQVSAKKSQKTFPVLQENLNAEPEKIRSQSVIPAL
jgi:hypothetical protein